MEEIFIYIASAESVQSSINSRLNDGWKLLGAPLPVPKTDLVLATNLILVTMYKPPAPDTSAIADFIRDERKRTSE